MTIQLPLFDVPATIPSPWCHLDIAPCPRAGRAVLGTPYLTDGGCFQQPLACDRCTARGESSTRPDCVTPEQRRRAESRRA